MDIKPDELIVLDSSDLQLDFDGKRDPYGGYDPATYRLVIRDFELADQERKRRKALELQEKSFQAKKQRKEKSSNDSDDDRCAFCQYFTIIFLIALLGFHV